MRWAEQRRQEGKKEGETQAAGSGRRRAALPLTHRALSAACRALSFSLRPRSFTFQKSTQRPCSSAFAAGIIKNEEPLISIRPSPLPRQGAHHARTGAEQDLLAREQPDMPIASSRQERFGLTLRGWMRMPLSAGEPSYGTAFGKNVQPPAPEDRSSVPSLLPQSLPTPPRHPASAPLCCVRDARARLRQRRSGTP